ncbi:MAG: LysM peptidoglycan-binding domain-containing protein [Anaerolineaceae bacterium]|nr:LysM peptidoglycan-binding domain-containing protein [Anaerolineaceae bacterium]
MKLAKVTGGLSILLLFVLSSCIKPAPEKEPWVLNINTPVISKTAEVTETQKPQRTPFLTATREPGKPMQTPTPDVPRVMPTLRSDTEAYSVQMNDSLNLIARRYGVDMNAIISENQITNPNLLEIGQVLIIPPPDPEAKGPDFKIIPDSELVFGPTSIGFDPYHLIYAFDSYLSSLDHSDEVVLQVAKDYSINPKILLSILEYSTGWVTGPNKDLVIEVGKNPETEAWNTGLFEILSRMANSLNWGYYSWRANHLGYYVLRDGSYFPASETINAGTAAVQYWAGTHYGKENWKVAVSEKGIFNTYSNFFGYPFDFSYEPLVPDNLIQPDFVLPFQRGVAWSFTGGPHPGWGDGSAWSALDFAPPGSPMGCSVSGDWVTAVADGLIVRSEHGAVIQDLDGDGYEQTGWVVLYMHIDYWERVAEGTFVNAGEMIGHPSCEGGVTTGTHLHIARRYNGEWIETEGQIPFVMSGFQPQSSGIAYNGFLVGNGVYIEAWEYFRPESLVLH